MTGTGVTIYFADTGYTQFNSGSTVTLSAPTTAVTGTAPQPANVLFFEKPGLSQSSFAFDTSTYNFTGVIHLPSRNLTFNAGANVTSSSFLLVVNTLIFDSVTWNLTTGTSLASNGSGTTSTTTTTTVTSLTQ